MQEGNTMHYKYTDIKAIVAEILENKKDEGKEFTILIENFSKRSREQMMGRTEQNKAVVIDKGNHHIGEFVKVRITGSTSATLFGEEVKE